MKKYNKKLLFGLISVNIAIVLFSLFYDLVLSPVNFEAFKCSFLDYVGIYCPGCGGSRSVAALFDLKLVRCFLLYPPILITSVLLLVYDICAFISIIKDDFHLVNKFNYKYVLIIPISIGINFLIRTVLLFFGFDLIKFALTINF